MSRLGRFVALCVLATITSLMVPSITAQAQTTNYQVQVGALHEGVPGESMRFFPSRMSVHEGDTITFSGGFHTATLLPTGTDAQVFVDENSVPADGPYAPFTADPDEGPAGLKFNNAVAFPTDPSCGAPDAPACEYDGSEVVNSGVFVFGPGSFTTTINAPAGETFWVICLVHSNMRMRVTVVPDDQAATTQASIDSAKASQIARDTDDAHAAHNRLLKKKTKHTTASGKTVWDAWAGFDMPGVTLYGMYPRKLSIRKGQTVRWHFNTLEYEVHTVTFPLGEGLDIANNSFVPSCDPDTDAGSMPDNPPDLQGPPFCSDPTQLELDLDPRFMDSGNERLSSNSDFENSGVRGDFLSRAPWDLRFTAKSPDGGFKYLCMIHPFMRGKVIVN